MSTKQYRFHDKKYRGDSRQGKSHKKRAELKPLPNKICYVCKEPFSGYVKVRLVNGQFKCFHERPIRISEHRLTQGEEKRIADRLAPNEMAVKGDDDIIRIVDRQT